MIYKLSLSIVFALCVSAQMAVAQQVITLDDAIRIALENNRDLKIADLETQKADAQVRQAYGLAMPSVTASGDYARALKKQVFFLPAKFMDPDAPDGKTVPIEVGSDHSLTMGFTASQVLFNSAVFTGVGTAKIYQQASRELRTATHQSTIAKTRRSFYQVLFIRDVLELTRASFKNAEDNLNNVRILNRQGIVSDYDLIRAEVQTENIRPMVTQAESNVVLAENGLKMTLGLSPDKDIQIDGDLEFIPVDAAVLQRADELLLENNASLKALSLQSEVNDELVAINRSEYLPTLAAYGTYQWLGQNNEFSKLTDDLISTSQVGLNISLNLFNGWQTTAKVDAAKIAYYQSQEQLMAAKDAMKTQLRNIRFKLEEARKRIEAQGKTVEQAEKGYKIATTRYSSGSGTQLEVNDADVALMQARVNKAQAVYDYNVAKADLMEILNIEE